ncbi:hypothetical protein NESM_000721100 [Novymonas esmeraldas]|uniref:Uncharacterized protein n=1 Tax=Novymonas esmeraldas TaxID=1808958 RepID=A0AAW0EUF8_9TRYP
MLLTRTLVLIFVLLLTVCGVCAALFPLMRKSGIVIAGHPAERRVYLWYEETKYRIGDTHYSVRAYHRDRSCAGFRTVAVAAAALDVAGCGIAAVVCLLAAAHLCSRKKFNICCSIMVLSFVTFICFAASVAAVTFVFCTETCVQDAAERTQALRDAGYSLVEGFIVLCVATGGFFLAIAVEIFS